MGCCHTCNGFFFPKFPKKKINFFQASNPNAHNPMVLEEISQNLKADNKEIYERKQDDSNTNLNSKPQIFQKINTNHLDESPKQNKPEENEVKKVSNEIISLDKITIIPVKEEEPLKKDPEKTAELKIDLCSQTELELNPPRKASMKMNSPMSKISFGPEIFVQMKTQNIFENYSVGQFLGKGISLFILSRIS